MTLSKFWHGVLHVLTIAGGLAALYPNPLVQQIGLAVVGLAGGTGAAAAFSGSPPADASPTGSAPAPSDTTPKSTAISSSIVSVFAVCLAGWAMIGGVGCSSVSQSQANTAAAVAGPLTEIVVFKVLDKNPQLEPVVQAVSDAAGEAFNGGALGAAQVNAIVIAVTAKYPQLSTSDQILITALLNQLIASYEAATGKTTLEINDPAAKTLIASFQTSIAQGLNLYNATKAASN